VKQFQETLAIRTRGRGLSDITGPVAAVVVAAGVVTGLCVVFCQHTSCSLLIQENASPDASADLLAWLARLAPDGDPAHAHTDEGPDDMPAHLRSAITRTSESIPVVEGRLALGRWQGLFLAEHRLAGSSRRIVVHVTGA
jgi:secondary thiamine-phosphate synthase enzyme